MFLVNEWLTMQMKPMRGAPSTVGSCELHAVYPDSAPADSLQLPLPGNEKGQLHPAMRKRQYNLFLWIMDIPSKWRPIYVLYQAPLHLFKLGLWLDSWRFYWWWTPWFISSVRQDHQLMRVVRTDMPNVLSPVVYDWLTDCTLASQLPGE